MFYNWVQNQQNEITFVLIDSSGSEVSGLGTGFTLELAKLGGSFVASAGAKSEISDGWYRYICTSAEADTRGLVSIKATHASVIQQNLLAMVGDAGSLPFAAERDYIIVENDGTPIRNVVVQISVDLAGSYIVWSGVSNAFGYIVDLNGNKPYLEPGTYYMWRYKVAYSFTNPDTEVFV